MNLYLKKVTQHKGQQSLEQVTLYHAGLVDGGKLALRTQIKRDTYDFQSYAFIDVFDHDQREWKHLASIPYSQLRVLKVFAYDKFDETTEMYFNQDRITLLDEAALILEI